MNKPETNLAKYIVDGKRFYNPCHIVGLLLNQRRFPELQQYLEFHPGRGMKPLLMMLFELFLDDDGREFDSPLNGNKALPLDSETKTELSHIFASLSKSELNTQNWDVLFWLSLERKNLSLAQVLLESSSIFTDITDHGGFRNISRRVCETGNLELVKALYQKWSLPAISAIYYVASRDTPMAPEIKQFLEVSILSIEAGTDYHEDLAQHQAQAAARKKHRI